MPDGPVTWEDLVKAAPLIKAKHPEIQIPIGIGMSQELDSNMAARAMLWSFDGSIQDANENVVLKSDHGLEALEFGVRLFKAGMNLSVMSWNAASNNQALNARQTGYILNSISAYRTAQDNKLPVADDTFFVPALKGPRGTGWASEHVMGIYVIWKFAQSPDVAKQFLLDLLGHYRDAVLGSKLYNFPAYTGSVADPGVSVAQKVASGNKWLEQVTANDPFGSNPPSKLKPISTALQWATNIGHPGPANPAESEIFDTFVLPTMFANAATGRMSAKQALDEAHQQLHAVTVSRHRELQLLQMIRGHEAANEQRVARYVPHETAEVLPLRRLAGAEQLGQRILVGQLVPVTVVFDPERAHETAQVGGGNDHRERRRGGGARGTRPDGPPGERDPPRPR